MSAMPSEDCLGHSDAASVPKIYEQIQEKLPANEPTKLDELFITDKVKKSLLFREELQLVTCDSEDELGKITISVSLSGANREYFVVRSSAEGLINGEECGATIMSLVDKNFITIQERRVEYANPGTYSNKYPSERKLFVAQDPEGYFCSLAQKHREEGHEDSVSSYLPYDYTKYMIGEGANLLLLRYLAITGFCGELDAVTITINGKLHLAFYTSSGPVTKVINGTAVEVVVVERTIFMSKTTEDKMFTTLTRTGQELRHEWDEWSYHYRVRPLQRIEEHIENEAVKVAIPLHLEWDKDIQMMSKYRDRKERRRASHNSYVLDHPEVRHLLSDFVQSLLLLKPKRVLPFAIDHFAPFRAPGKPGDDVLLEENLFATHGKLGV